MKKLILILLLIGVQQFVAFAQMDNYPKLKSNNNGDLRIHLPHSAYSERWKSFKSIYTISMRDATIIS